MYTRIPVWRGEPTEQPAKKWSRNEPESRRYLTYFAPPNHKMIQRAESKMNHSGAKSV